jgi:acyl-CoA synthetase (AMP-forming)/AMP-acid ligase II/1-acyl-sn-glycerol-3-phosphate acyltransferase/acyl carrier protein
MQIPGNLNKSKTMRKLFDLVFLAVARCLIWLRYRVRVTGLEKLKSLHGPILVLPNHPAYVDPLIVLAHVRLGRPLRPIVYADTYRHPLVYPFMPLIRAFEVPNLSKASRQSRQQAVAMLDAVAAALNRGDSLLLYPSGRLVRTGIEIVGSARSAAEFLERCPQANVVLARTTGLWGSMFGCARTGTVPDLGKSVLEAMGWLIASLVFFMPRRDVHLELEVLDRSRLPGTSREELNPFLERWYNQGQLQNATSVEPIFVRYHGLFGPRQGDFLAGRKQADDGLQKIPAETQAAVDDLVEARLNRVLEPRERTAATPLDALGLDSLDRMQLSLEIEGRFGFQTAVVTETMGDLYRLAAGQAASSTKNPARAAAVWIARRLNDEPAEIVGLTIAEAFVRRCLASPRDVAVADPMAGVLTYRRMLVATSLLSRRIARLQGDAVGILLPSSAAADLAFLAVHLAGKLPVMLNWTTGEAGLATALKTARVREVITSEKLVDRLGIELPGADMIFLEDLRKGMTKREQAMMLLAAVLRPARFLRELPRQQPDDPAVVLFTSGSESTPKAVPLTHDNLISTSRASIQAIALSRRDAVLGFLPPFHSFGLLGNLVAPILAGVPMVHHPDPTDARGLVAALTAHGATAVFSTPTFLASMLAVGSQERFASLRLIVMGAEKCPEAVFERCRRIAPAATLLEGYGITECSAVVSLNRPGAVVPGSIGRPIDGYEFRIVHPERMCPVPPGEPGMLLVRGPSVFHGYMNYDGPSPMTECDGLGWYRTGDLVTVDAEGCLVFRGRLKRFLKAGGEMISLPALEEPFSVAYPPTENGPQVAVEGIELPEGRRIALFTTVSMTLREANARLVQAGLRGVMRLDEVRHVESIPVLGTGKTDYMQLRRLVDQGRGAGCQPAGNAADCQSAPEPSP